MGHPMSARLQPPSPLSPPPLLPHHVRRMKMYCLHSIITHDEHTSAISLSPVAPLYRVETEPVRSLRSQKASALVCHIFTFFCCDSTASKQGALARTERVPKANNHKPAQESRPLAKEASTLPLTAVSCYVTTHSCFCKRGHLSVSDISKGHREEK